ncbi:DUF3099 domain-containing protein [Microbacterium esteraromaticum]|uniref:DUF3099 domain-containing protein n=1 Tax=Microbacterium esteraromaticum TaxID=57043 RepID=UPI003C2EE59E
MKRVRHAPSVTSLPQSPQDEAKHRVRRYALTMGIRTICFLLIALVQPFGWWTWVFAAAAIFLPYIAVVYANAGSDSTPSNVESPTMQIEATSAMPQPHPDDATDVFTIREQPDIARDDVPKDEDR